MSTLFEDTFTGTAGASITSRNSDSGGSWVKNSGFTGADLKLAAGGTCYPDGTIVMVTDNTAVTDVEVETDVAVKSSPSPTFAYAGILLRGSQSGPAWHTFAVNTDSTYSFFGYDTALGDYTVRVAPTDGGNFRPLYGVGTHKLKMSVKGSGTALYRAFVDNREVYRYGSALADSGRIGVICGAAGTSTTGNHFDSFRASNDFSRNQIQFVGDSMTFGEYNNDAGTQVLNVGWDNQWPAVVMSRIFAAGGDADWANLGSSGKTLASMNSQKSSILTEMGTPYMQGQAGGNAGYGFLSCRRTNAAKDILVLMGGLNDILSTGQSAAGAYSDASAIITAGKAAGFYIIHLTNPLCEEGTHAAFTVPAGSNTKLAALNDLIRANSAGADAIVDLDADPLISTDTSNTTYRSVAGDGVHWLPAAQSRVADLVYPAVAAAFGLVPGSSFSGGRLGPFATSPFLF